jgi:hypothetical protein
MEFRIWVETRLDDRILEREESVQSCGQVMLKQRSGDGLCWAEGIGADGGKHLSS